MLLKETDEIKKYISVDGSFQYETVFPYIEIAENEVKKILGKAQYDELNDYYNGPGTGIDELDALLPYCQRSIAYFAFLKGLDKFNVSIGNNGIGVIQNSNLAPASKERVENLRKNINESAWDSIEALLEFLEENIDDYPLWSSSSEYAYQYEYLISSARKFDELYKIERSRVTFLNWRPAMADVEKITMEPVVSKKMLDELKEQIKKDSVTEANQKILPLLQKALAYLTAFSQQKKNENIERYGMRYLMMAKAVMDASPDDYPTYKNSSVYDETLENYIPYENDEDMNIAVF